MKKVEAGSRRLTRRSEIDLVPVFAAEVLVRLGAGAVRGQDAGPDGVDGEESYVFEYEFSFTAPDYSVILNLPNDKFLLWRDKKIICLVNLDE